jgi:hypothetical protein
MLILLLSVTYLLSAIAAVALLVPLIIKSKLMFTLEDINRSQYVLKEIKMCVYFYHMLEIHCVCILLCVFNQNLNVWL